MTPSSRPRASSARRRVRATPSRAVQLPEMIRAARAPEPRTRRPMA